MAQFQCMDARLGTINDELCQVNTHVGCIVGQQACLGGFVESPSPSPEASKDEDNDGNSDGGDTNEDEALALLVTTNDCFSVTYPLTFVTKSGSSFGCT